MSEVPEIEIQVKNVTPDRNSYIYEAKCPVEDCNWSEESDLYSELEEQVYAHEDWHENGMPE